MTAPDGTVRVGNQAGGALASLDTREQRRADSRERTGDGVWNVDVIGSNVPQGPARYAW